MVFKKIIIYLVFLSIFAKVIFLFASGVYLNPQVFEYEDVVVNLLEGKGFYYDHFNTRYYGGIAPGFPVLCYIVYKIFGHHLLLIILIEIAITSLIVIPVSLITRRIFDEKAGIISGLLAALHPPLIVYSTTKLHTMTIYSFLFAFLVWLFLLIRESVTLRRVIVVGIVGGLTILFRVTTIAFLLLGLTWFLAVSGNDIKKKAGAVALILFISFLISLPWGIRNYAVFGKPLLLQTNKWESLWYGNMPGSSGSLYGDGGITLLDREAKNLSPEFFKMNETEQGEYLKQLTLGYFKADPPAFIGRILKKIYYFWYFSPNQGNLYPKLWMKLYKAWYIFIIISAIFSIIYNLIFLKGCRKQDVVLVLMFFLALTWAHSLYFVEARHRWSIEPLVLVFTANGLIVIKDFVFRILKSARAS